MACGSISSYNDASQSVLPNWFEIISNRITVQGFLVFDCTSHFVLGSSKAHSSPSTVPEKVPEAKAGLAAALKAGQLKTTGKHETVREVSFEEIPKVWETLFVGANTGKLITKIAGL